MIPPELAALTALGLVPVLGGKSPAFTAAKDRVLDGKVFDALKSLALKTPGSTVRINLHPGPEAPVHDMVIAVSAGGPPYVHRHHRREETYHLIEGRLRLRFYDDAGRATETRDLGGPGTSLPLIARIPAGRWHSTEPLTPVALFHESRPGPFDPADTILPTWTPQTD